MLDYLKKFNGLPPELRQKVSNPAVLAAMEGLEKKFRLALAALVMKVMIKEVSLKDLAGFLIKEKLNGAAAGELANELKERVFKGALAYLDEPALNDQPRPFKKNANFFFSPDDETEIRDLSQKINEHEKKELSAAAIDTKLSAITSRAQINFGSADLALRFNQIIRTYLRGIRNKLETKLTLMKSFENGGLSFDDLSAQKIMDLTDKVLNSEAQLKFKKLELDEAGEAAKPLPKIKIKEAEERDAPYDFTGLSRKKSEAEKRLPRLEQGANKQLPSFKTDKEKKEPVKLDKVKKVPELAPLPPAAVKAAVKTDLPLIKRRFAAENSNQGQKPKLEDVKYMPRVMGPLDEIKYLDLINFRRLDKDPFQAARKIKNKINLLAEESYGQRLEAIKLWRSSPLNKIYLNVGHLSISENRPVDVIIKESQDKKKETLTPEEFEAIMDLNKSLRF